MLISTLKTNLGKSAHGGQTLYCHLIDCAKVAHRVLTDHRFAPADYPNQKRDQLLFSTFIHDIGKLDPRFQEMLRAARDKQRLPATRVKHEASTLDFEHLFRESEDEIKGHLGEVLDYRFTGKIDIDDALAFALGHHGLFHLSFEARNGEVLRRVRRDTTVFGYREQRRITLTDLLFDYHPLGGIVMISDLLASFSFEQRLGTTEDIIARAQSFHELIALVARDGTADRVEESIKRYDPRAYGLRELLTLLAGGLA